MRVGGCVSDVQCQSISGGRVLCWLLCLSICLHPRPFPKEGGQRLLAPLLPDAASADLGPPLVGYRGAGGGLLQGRGEQERRRERKRKKGGGKEASECVSEQVSSVLNVIRLLD